MQKLICFFIVLLSLNSFSQKEKSKLEKLHESIQTSTNDSIKIVNYLRLNAYYHVRDLNKADSLLTEILKMLDTVDYDSRKHQGQIYSRRGIISRIRSNYPKSLRNYNKANKLYEQIKDTNKLITINMNIGNLYSYQYDYISADKHFKKAVNINTKPYKKQLGVSYRMLAGNFNHREMMDSAFYYLEKARVIFKDTNADLEYFASNIQFVRYSLQEYHSKYPAEELDGKRTLQDLNGTYSYNDLISMAKETTRFFKKEEHKHYLTESYYDLAKINYEFKKYQLAKKYADTTILLANQIEKKHLESKTYELRSMIYEKIGKLSLALKDYKTYEKTQNDIYTDKKSKEIKEIEMANAFAKKKLKDSILFVKQKEILVLEKDKALAQNKFIGLLSIIGLVIAFFIIRILRKRWIKERKLGKLFEKKLKKSDEEISILSSDKKKLTEEVNELLTETVIHLQTKEKLANNLSKLSHEEEGVTLKGIIAELKADKLEDSKILVLKKNIETLNYDFLKSLKVLHPNLTKTDIEVCSFIKIGFSRKEIASLRKTSIDAIKSTRFRLKKKLNLGADQSLDEYITSISVPQKL
ncbi:tetratricopeptide repeat protein [Tenacibaculum sp. 190524A05c]|uniref:transcriptional regulator n=1 Tax=Tenacibaculum platacis TaxID=3137852 RepID=UPI0031FA810C